jgi:hypothetical protein
LGCGEEIFGDPLWWAPIMIICTIEQLWNIPKQVYCKDQKTRVSPDVSPTTKSTIKGILMYINARYD